MTPTPEQLKQHLGYLPTEFRRAAEELYVAKIIGVLFEHMPSATMAVVLEMAAIFKNAKRRSSNG
jgi:hypothetical protein